jgi:hypothetical protein
VNVSDEDCVLIHKSFDQVKCEHRIIRYFIYFFVQDYMILLVANPCDAQKNYLK